MKSLSLGLVLGFVILTTEAVTNVLSARYRNSDGNVVIPIAVPKNTGDFTGPSGVNHGGGFGVAPAVPKNPDGTAVSPEEIMRQRLCGNTSPKTHRYHEKTRRCYAQLVQGPCGENMIFNGTGPVYGDCDCYTTSGVPLVYLSRTDRCYYIYQQAYCLKGQWLAFDRNGQPGCTDNTCLKSPKKEQRWESNIPPDVVPIDGNGPCVRLNSREGCTGNDVILFKPRHVWPSCGNGLNTKFISPVGVLPCPAGSKSSILGNCHPDIDWDF